MWAGRVSSAVAPPGRTPTVRDLSLAQHDGSGLREAQRQFDREIAVRQAPDAVGAEESGH